MKKTAIIVGAVLFLFTATVNAQNDTLPKQPTMSQQDQLTNKQQVTATTTTTSSGDKWNNWSPDKYKMLPMPEPLTTEKIFPVLGHYSVTAKNNSSTTETTTENSAGASSNVTITLDDNNKGIVWVEVFRRERLKPISGNHRALI
jgi:hypothetical protein